jgi:hypothetical protein
MEKEVHTEIVIVNWSFIYCIPFSVTSKGNDKITEPRTIFQRESKNS